MLKAVDIPLLQEAADSAGKAVVSERIDLLTTLVVAGILLIVVVMAISFYQKRRSNGSD